MKYLTTMLAAMCCFISSANLLQAQVPQIVAFTGQLSGVDANLEGSAQFKFALINSAGTISYWSNDLTSSAGSQPTNAVTLTVNDGVYSVGLGNTALAHMQPVPGTVFANSGVFIRVWVNDGTNGWQKITPDQPMGAAGYAMFAAKVPTASVGSGQLASNLTLFGTTKIQGVLSIPGTTSATVGVLTVSGVPFLHDLGLTNTFLGGNSGNFVMTGSYNTALGEYSLVDNTTGNYNTALGVDALYYNTTGSNNIAIGLDAGLDVVGSNNIEIGNYGNYGDSNTVRLGSSTQTQTYLYGTTDVAGSVGITGGLNVDNTGQNTGTIDSNALNFGVSSGEGIVSDRSATGVSPYDLELWTDFANRVEIQQQGNVGIGTATPTQKLEVNGGYILVDGNSGVKVYIGDDGTGNDAQIGSFKSGVTNVACYNATDNKYMRLVCSSLQINGGSDLAEPFAITKAKHPVSEGSVVVIDEANPGHLTLGDRPYDTRVAGVVSGANGVHPGIQMRQDGLLDGDENVALTGRVYVQADASNGAIEPGDMLTTSGTPGVAMKVTDHVRAQGAILGKAMTSLKDGHGMVLVLVTLQ